MNFSHIHLILNHIPVIGLPIATVFLSYGMLSANKPTMRFSLFMLGFLALMAIPVYFTGEPAEKLIEHLPGVSESFISPHENAALISVILTIATGLTAAIAFVVQKQEKRAKVFNLLVLGFAFVSILSLLYTANLGGQVRHTELRAGSEIPLPEKE